MPYVEPIEAAGWPDSELTIDRDTDTYSEITIAAKKTGTALVVIYPPTRVDRLMFMASVNPAGIQTLNLQISYDGAWHTLKSGYFTRTDKAWICHTFDPHEVDGILFQFANTSIKTTWVRMWEVVLGTCCRGPLADFCDVLYSISSFWSGFGEDIADVAIVGDFLSAPFLLVADWFKSAGNYCCQFSGWLEDTLAGLSAMLSWDAILALIQEHSPGLYAFITDPIDYIYNIVIGWIPELPDWLDDPIAWLKSVLEEHAPVLYYFWTDPFGEVLYLIGQVFKLEPYQTQTPEFIVKALIERYFPELYRLWIWLSGMFGIYDRDGWLGVVKELKTQFYGLAENAIRFFWEGEWPE